MAEIYQKYLDPQTLARLQGLDLRARHVVDGFVSGMHRHYLRFPLIQIL